MKKDKKYPRWTAEGMAIMLLCTLFMSCNNEDFLESVNPKEANGYICFGTTSDNDVQTKGSIGTKEKTYTSHRFVLRASESDDTLCIRALVSEDIHPSDKTDATVVTRGMPVDNTNFYDQFHVLAYWQKSGSLVEQFYMDDNVLDKGTTWKSDQVYYWPGAEHTLQFYAWAPIYASGLTAPTSPDNKTLTYTVPAEATAQKDIVVAGTSGIQGDYNQAVSLPFKHICTAVRFAVGSQMQPGSIKSVALTGIQNTGTYDMESGTWTLGTSKTDFSQDLNKTTTGTEASGTEITTANGTFMMLPQTLPADAMIKVVFTNAKGMDRTLTAPIGNTVWTMGNTTTYRLSITPEYELEFTSTPEVKDAHYVIYPITFKANNLSKKGWTLTSNDKANVTFMQTFPHEDLKELVDKGYWLKDYCGTSTLTGTSTGEVKVYVFLKENVSEQDRDIVLSLASVDDPTDKPVTFTFKQYCPIWNNGIGVERIQGADYPWGFNWDSNMKITYSMPQGFVAGWYHFVYLLVYDTKKYVSSKGNAWAGTWKVTIDFSKVPKLTTATSSTDGLQNTWELYDFEGISEASEMMDRLVRWGGVPDKTLPKNPSEYAALECAKKNKFGVNKVTQGDQVAYIPVLDKADLVWYLPAKDEAYSMSDTSMTGNYWTSTAITDPGTTSYKYNVEGNATTDENRQKRLHVRAVRSKP